MDTELGHKDINEIHNHLGWYIALAAGMIVLGIFAIFVPFLATLALEQLAGILFAVGGIILIVHAFRWRISERFFVSFFLGLIYFAFGILLLAYPLSGMLTLTLALGIFFLFTGIYKIYGAYRMRPAPGWGWALFSGIVSLLLSVFIWGGLPLTALWVIGLIVGIDLMISGWALLMIMMAVRTAFNRHEAYCIGGECFSF